jgi:hypothetical protein
LTSTDLSEEGLSVLVPALNISCIQYLILGYKINLTREGNLSLGQLNPPQTSESGREPSRAFTTHRVPPLSAHIDALVSNEYDNTPHPTATKHAQVITDNSISEHRLCDSAAIVHIISSSCSVSSWRSVSAAA